MPAMPSELTPNDYEAQFDGAAVSAKLHALRVKRGTVEAISIPTGSRGETTRMIRQPDEVTDGDKTFYVRHWQGYLDCDCGEDDCQHVAAVERSYMGGSMNGYVWGV